MYQAVIALVVSVVVAGSVAGAAELNNRKVQRASSVASAGMEQLKSGNLSRASELFEEALTLVPNLPDAHMGLGHVAMARHEYETAVKYYTAVRDEMTELNAKAFDQEQRRYEQALRRIPDLQDEITGLKAIPGANIDQAVRSLEQQIAALQLVKPPIRKKPADIPAEVLFYRGNALFHMRRLEEALADWKESVRIDPKFAPVYNNLAVVHWKLGHVEEAKAALAQAKQLGVKVNPEFEAALGH